VSYIRTPEALAEAIAALSREPIVAADTEAASFHRYHDRIFLIQLSSPSRTEIIDPLTVADLSPVGRLLADPKVEKIFHDADYDLRILDRDYGFRARRLFDTRIAAQLAGEPAVGLAALLEKYAGVKLAKEHQKADWSRRPLPPAMLAYAAADTAHLPALREQLRARLTALGRLTWAEEEFARLEDLRWTRGGASDGGGPGGPGGPGGSADPDAFLRVKRAKALAPQQLAALRELYRWREAQGAELDRATFRIIGNDALLAVAKALPRTPAELSGIAALPPSLAARHGPALLDGVRRALALPESELPRVERTPRQARDPAVEARVERLKAARNRAAAELGLDPGVLCGRSTLEAVARAQPPPNDRAGLSNIGELRRWQIEAFGEALLAALG
jgi:ribonuclease D